MQSCSLPFGEPVFFEGQYEKDEIYPLYIQCISCGFEIKKNKIPTIQVRHNKDFLPNEYLETSNDQEITLILTNNDLELFFDHYDTFNLKYKSGWKFKCMKGMFSEYIEKWIERKNKATIEGNKGQRTLCKLMLNSLYRKICDIFRNKVKISISWRR